MWADNFTDTFSQLEIVIKSNVQQLLLLTGFKLEFRYLWFNLLLAILQPFLFPVQVFKSIISSIFKVSGYPQKLKF